jgi:hypothetical protein
MKIERTEDEVPIHIDPRWEYFTTDEEIEEILSWNRSKDFDSILDGRRDWFADGIRFGKGNPNHFNFKLARPRPERCQETLDQRECQRKECNEVFWPRRASQRYCSRECRPITAKTIQARGCARSECPVVFTPQRDDRRYCSPRCAALVGGEITKVERLGDGCRICGEIVPPDKYPNRKKPKKFCSPRCKRISASRTYRQNKTSIQRECPMDVPSWLSEGHKLRNAAIRLSNARKLAMEKSAGNGHVAAPATALIEDYRAKLLDMLALIHEELAGLGSVPQELPIPAEQLFEAVPDSPIATTIDRSITQWQQMADSAGEAVLIFRNEARAGRHDEGTYCSPLSMVLDSEKSRAIARLEPSVDDHGQV